MAPTAKNPKVPDSHEGTVSNMTPFEKFCRVMAGRATLDSAEKTVDYGSIEAILTAETEEEMWTADDRGPLGGRDLAGVVQRVHEIEVKFSSDSTISSPFFDPETGRNFYLLITSTREDDSKYTGKRSDIKQGDKFQWNTSAPRLVSKLMWLEGHERLNQPIAIEAIDLGGGQHVLKLRPATSGYVNQGGPTLMDDANESPF